VTGPYPTRWVSDVVLSDGGIVHLRPIRNEDADALLGLYTRLSDESLYLRFFSPVQAPTARQLEALTDLDYDQRFALVAELGDDLVAVARFDRLTNGTDAEVAFTVQDDQQGRGLGSILLEHLAAAARELGVRRFVASTLAGNVKMLRVFRDAGFEVSRHLDGGTVEVSFPIDPTPTSIDAQNEREHVAEARSMQRLLKPASVAVIGASRQPGTIGHAVFRNVLDGDFTGPVYPVNRAARSVAGVRAYPSVRDVPDDVDLAVIAVPAEHVLDVAHDCVDKGVAGMVVISAGFAEVGGQHASDERALVELARRHGMRIIGPNCMGIINTHPDVRLNATFAPINPAPGRVGFASQSGGLGIELLARAGEFGLNVSTFVSMGNKADVSSNDFIQYWDEDPDTDVILLYLESFGNPRKFSRLARRVARHKPIVAVKGGRTPAGERATSSHTAALAAPDVAVDALFRQAGVIRVDTLEELFGVGTVVRHQPLPPGRRVGVITNGGGPGILAADACAASGLEVPELSSATQAALRSFVSPDAAVANPVDLVASASAEQFERAVHTLLDDPVIDALIVLFVPPLVTRAEDVADAVMAGSADTDDKPVVACFLGRNGTIDLLSAADGARRIPSFAFPEAAAGALAHAAQLAEWRQRPVGQIPELDQLDLDAAQRIVSDRLAHHPDGEWLDPHVARDLLSSVGVPVLPTVWVATADGAVAAARDLGGPVALKAGSGSIVHKADVGAVRLGLVGDAAVRDAFTTMQESLGDTMGGAVVQPMVEAGVETIVGVTRDRSFGSLVLFGMGGFQAELVRDTALRIVPVTDVDAAELVRSLRGSPLLFGYRNLAPVAVDVLEDLLVRVGQLADAVPEVAELDCNPVIVSAVGATAVDVKVRLAPVGPAPPPGVRRLREPPGSGS
jgi:acetyl coenzyme A synthetase (ADP forming)-like protein